MKQWLLQFGIFCFRILLKLRYRITYKGLEEAMKGGKKGVLFLSNHPALCIDGLVVALPLLKACRVRTLILESMFFSRWIAPILRLIRALPVPDFGTGSNSSKLYRLHHVLDEVSCGLRQGENFLIYPAGMTKQTGREVLGGTFAVYDILKARPTTPVVMIRIVGLWGSRFSRAQSAGNPVDMAKAFSESLWDVLKAAIFFMPKRPVEVTFERVSDMPRTASKLELNRWLEAWFNAPFEQQGRRGEELSLVSYSPWKSDLPEITKREAVSIDRVRPDVQQKVVHWIATALKKPETEISMTDNLVADLGMDSLMLAELITYLEAEMESPRIMPQDVSTVASLCLAAQGDGASCAVMKRVWSTKLWNKPRKHKRCYISREGTIVDQFFATADKNLFHCAAVDDVRGPLSYRQLKQAVFTLAHHIKKRFSSERIGILLPNTTAAHLVTLACQLAGKTPVMLNWTVGAKHLESVVALTELETVLTSWSFLDILENVDLTPVQDKMLFLEEFKASFSLVASVQFLLLSYLPYAFTKSLRLFPERGSQDVAVLLFTSGTESEPKGVPLTHANILNDLYGALQAIQLFSTDSLMSILPPFHSFGFTVTGLMPLLAGIRTCFYPNPTDGGAVFERAKEWNLTLLCGAPSFLKNILLHSKNSFLPSLRLIVTGAEAASSELFSLAEQAAPFAHIIEGYGITECSPILTINYLSEKDEGVGRPIFGVKLKIVDPEHHEVERSKGSDGLILASGPSIFQGYLQSYLSSPFYEGWYVTGDLGHLTEKGALILTGRLKRFVKLGGEMVSLGAVESGLEGLLKSETDDGPTFAVVAVEDRSGHPKLVLFSTKEISASEATVELRRKGFSNLIRIDQVKRIDAIPVTALGKVAIGTLGKMVSYE